MSRVLVVEDNAANQLLTCSILEREGFQTDVAESSVEALKVIDEHRPDLILMDLQLPGVDGLTLTRRLKTIPELKEIPIVAVTAHAMIGDRASALAAGCAGYISKPIDTRTLGAQVRAFLRSAAPKAG